MLDDLQAPAMPKHMQLDIHNRNQYFQKQYNAFENNSENINDGEYNSESKGQMVQWMKNEIEECSVRPDKLMVDTNKELYNELRQHSAVRNDKKDQQSNISFSK